MVQWSFSGTSIFVYPSYYIYFHKFQFATPTSGTNIAYFETANTTFRKENANRIVKPSFLKDITFVADIDLTEESIPLGPKAIFLGGTNKATMNQLLNNGDITQPTYDQFHKGVQLYYKDALDYIQRKFPISDPVICNSGLVVLQRDKAEWNQIEFFIKK